MNRRGAGKPTSNSQEQIVFSTRTVIIIYFLTLAGFFAASFLTQYRIWGLSSWGYLPLWGRALLLVIGLVAIPLALKAGGPERSPENKSAGDRSFVVFGFAILVISGLCFWFFPGSTHFLGDGYLNLSTMSGDSPSINYRELGESLSHYWLAELLGGTSRENVLLSYQYISIVAGLVFVILTLWSAKRIFPGLSDRVLFTLGILSAGNLLLFFGYVENYALFAVAVTAFVFVGILVAQSRISRWFVLVPLALACFLHILGVTLVPAAVYLLFADQPVGRRISNLSRAVKLTLVGGTLAAAGAGLWVAAAEFPFFRLALLGLINTRFTIEGYTLFSANHLIDFLNLTLLLFPAAPLLVYLVIRMRRQLGARPELSFLGLLLVSVLGGVFIFDPKLGLPRDWDCFSFPATVMAAFLIFLSLDGQRGGNRSQRITVVLAVMLGFLSMSARVATQRIPEMGVRQIQDYISLDPIKEKSALICLQEYYAGIGDKASFRIWGDKFASYPDEQLVSRADALIGKNKLDEAYADLRRAIAFNPMTSAPYTFLSVIYLRQGKLGAARVALDTALMLNATNPQAHVGMGFLEQAAGKLEEAKRWYRRGIAIAPAKALGYYYLARLNLGEGDTAAYLSGLRTAIDKSDAGGDMCQELTEAYARRGEFAQAAAALKRGIELRLDSSAVSGQLLKYPQMKRFMDDTKPAK